MNIYLIGGRAVGKSGLARKLSEKTQRIYYDMDDLIVYDAGLTIPEIIKKHGWRYFRDLEFEVARKLGKLDNLIVACGGGVMIDLSDNDEEEYSNRKMSIFKETGKILWLTCDIKTQLKYLKQGNHGRPSLTGTDPAKELESVMNRRKPFYERAADMIIDTSHVSLDTMAEDLSKKITGEF